MRAPDLALVAARLVHKLGGTWRGDNGMCLCPAHADRNPSLSVRLGDRALLFTCFAGCDRRDIIRAIVQFDRRAMASLEAPAPIARQSASVDAWLRQRARELWEKSRPIAGTQAAAYLARRSLVSLPSVLRFCGATPLGQGKDLRYRPAMIAAVQDGSGLLGVQRTFLEWGQPRRARDLGNSRRMLGRPYGGAVMLAEAGPVLGLAEGTETAMSAMAILGLPVWATLGARRLCAIALPSIVERIVLLPDHDAAGQVGAAKAVDAYARLGLRVDVLWPPAGFKDWNDVLRKGEKGGGMGGARWTEWLARCRQEIQSYV